MRNSKTLLLKQLNKQLQQFQAAARVPTPEKGWIRAIRTGLNMTLEQLGNKLNITKQGIRKIEESEAKGSISLKSLQATGEAMDMRLVYGFVPKDGDLENLIQQKAEDLARKIVLRTNQNMLLEDQGIGKPKLDAAIDELAYEIKREMRRSMWD